MDEAAPNQRNASCTAREALLHILSGLDRGASCDVYIE